MCILLKLISGLTVIPIKILAAGCVVDIDKLILKLIWKLKTNTQTKRIAKKCMGEKKNKCGGIILATLTTLQQMCGKHWLSI